MNRGQEYSRVRGLRPGRSVFDLSYSKKFSGRMGFLYPVLHDEMVPGDVFDLACSAVVRFAPMVAPPLQEIILKADWYFVPYRILFAKSSYDTDGLTAWERFITGGQDGAEVARSTLGVLDLHATPVPEGGMWDHLGVPPGVTTAVTQGDDSPLLFPGMAYNCIWNNYYRDPNLESERDLTACAPDKGLDWANWDADYFTRAMPTQQRGSPVGLPISGSSQALWDNEDFVQDTGEPVLVNYGGLDPKFAVNTASYPGYLKTALEKNTVDLGEAVTFDIADLRVAAQVQKWLERSMRGGYRYTEFLQSHFGESPRDERLDRPEYIGGVRQPIVISEVLQTSKTETGAPQGNLAGHGIMAGNHRIGKYHAREYGIIMCLMSVQPRPGYFQGINRQWLRVSRYDFYHPEFANLSEQDVKKEEIYFGSAQADNLATFGWQGRYDEMRSKRDMVCGAFRSSLDYWHLARKFASLPSLSSSFGYVDPSSCTRIFAVPSADHLYVHWGNIIRGIRPMPLQSDPGMMDHSYGGL